MSWRLPFLRTLARFLDCSILAVRSASPCLVLASSLASWRFGGNVDTVCHQLPAPLRQCPCCWRLTVCYVIARSYRGYGLSDGSPSEGGLQMDAQAALDYLLKERPDIDRHMCIMSSTVLS